MIEIGENFAVLHTQSTKETVPEYGITIQFLALNEENLTAKCSSLTSTDQERQSMPGDAQVLSLCTKEIICLQIMLATLDLNELWQNLLVAQPDLMRDFSILELL